MNVFALASPERSGTSRPHHIYLKPFCLSPLLSHPSSPHSQHDWAVQTTEPSIRSIDPISDPINPPDHSFRARISQSFSPWPCPRLTPTAPSPQSPLLFTSLTNTHPALPLGHVIRAPLNPFPPSRALARHRPPPPHPTLHSEHKPPSLLSPSPHLTDPDVCRNMPCVPPRGFHLHHLARPRGQDNHPDQDFLHHTQSCHIHGKFRWLRECPSSRISSPCPQPRPNQL